MSRRTNTARGIHRGIDPTRPVKSLRLLAWAGVQTRAAARRANPGYQGVANHEPLTNEQVVESLSGTILMVFGTRPEAIKMAPLAREIKRSSDLDLSICVTGQHREMLDQVMRAFDLKPDFDLDLMQVDQTLTDITSRVLTGVGKVIEEVKPAIVTVQGDTTTAMAGALAAYYAQIPIAHVEAGLRTGQKYSPFPEEVNRAIIDVMADLYFPPTESAHQNLLHAGVGEDSITVTGNTAIDAVLLMKDRVEQLSPGDPNLGDIPFDLAQDVATTESGRRLILVTGHRRESFGDDLDSICRALLRIADEHEDVQVAYAVHLNPHVRESVYRILGGSDRVRLFEPPAYPAFVWLMSRAHLIISDSGGIQEEAPALNKPLLVTRRVTERPEAADSGCARLVGVDTKTIFNAAHELLTNDDKYCAMAAAPNPFGDGRASKRIVSAIENWLANRE
jgi:UDP-N-acetylglucosamine 2-epimerase